MKSHDLSATGASRQRGFSAPGTLWVVALSVVLLATATVFWWPRSEPVEPAASPSQTQTEVQTLRLGLNIAADSALQAGAVRFSDLVGERSGGKLKITVYPNQQLGNDDQMLELARNGKLDLVLTPTAKLSSAVPAMQYADLPFYFSGREELYAMLDGEPGQMLLSKLNAIGLVGLTFWENGFKQFTTNTPIRSPNDFAKLRIRIMKSRIIADQFESLGAKAIPIDFQATHKALADGAVDGQENPLVAIVAMRIHEVQKHLTLSNHAYLGYVFSASKQVFESLPPAKRDILLRTARELTVWEREETARRETAFLETIRAASVTIYSLTPEERQAFSTVLAPIADKFGFEVGYDLLAKTDELRLARNGVAPNSRPLLIGLDADLSAGGAQANGAIYRGIQLAVEEINQKGGLLGTPLRLTVRDNGANPQVAQQNLARFAAMPSLLAVVGGMQTSVIVDELEAIHSLRLPFLIPWAAGPGLTAHQYRPSYTFRVSISDAVVMPFLLRHALKSGGSVAVLLDNSGWGRSNEAVLKPLLEKLPGNSVVIDRINIGDPDIEAKIKGLARGGAHALIMVADSTRSRAIVRAMARLEKPLPIYAHWGLTGIDFWTAERAALRRVDLRFVQSILVDETRTNSRLREFVERYRKRYGLGPDEPLPSLVGSVQAYDAVHLLGRAVIQAKSTDRLAIRAALETLRPYTGVMRDYATPFTRDRHDALVGSTLHLARFDAGGRIIRAD